MNRQEFDALPVKEQIEFINQQLVNGSTLTSLSREINIGRTTIRDRFAKHGYTYNKYINQYESYIEVADLPNEFNNTSSNSSHNYSSSHSSSYSSNKVVGANMMNNQALQAIITKYTEMYDKVDAVYNWYEEAIVNKNMNTDDIIDSEANLVIEDFEGNIVPRSYKLYESVAKEFAEFCKANNKYKIQDILSQFIKEGLDKYGYKNK